MTDGQANKGKHGGDGKRVKVPQNTAIKVALNRKVQVVAPAMNQAFRRADMHNNI